MLSSTDLSSSVTGVILAGGRGERMGGQDKGLLSLAGEPLVGHLVRILRPQVGALIINANRNLGAYRQFGCPVVSDETEDYCGPLAGMLAALDLIHSTCLLSVPCDSPLLPSNYARRMVTALLRARAELSVAHDGHRLQPVFTLLRVELRDSLRRYLESGERKIDRWFLHHRLVKTDFSDCTGMFHNINTPEDLMVLEKEFVRGSCQ
jgi:molybdenum cofactor guanylyltransferase